MAKNSRLDFSGQPIYVGLDVSRKRWEVSIFTQEFEHKTFTQAPPSPEGLVRYLRAHFPGATYRCVYEAGFSGFWAQEALERLGVSCLVTHPADVPTTDKERRFRRDRVDARKLARNLRDGRLRAIYVPSREVQEDRSLVRTRFGLVKKQTRCRNQIKGLLHFYGFTMPSALERSHWSGRFLKWLEGLTFEGPSGQETMRLLLEELVFLRQQLVQVTRKLRALAQEDRYRGRVRNLTSIPGIGPLTALVLLVELVDLERFKTFDQLASYVGLVPGEDSTGDREVVTGLTFRRHALLRGMLVETSWMAVRKDPALAQSFLELAKRMPKNRAIIRIARKLLNRIRYVMKHDQPYVIGVLA